MISKNEERTALERIKKIIDGLGGDESYVGRAFAGCFEMAENNIDDDLWNSMVEQRDSNRAEAEKWMSIAEETKKELSACKQNRENAEEDARFFAEQARRYSERSEENWNKYREMEDRAGALELENMKLKAKLYDLLLNS